MDFLSVPFRLNKVVIDVNNVRRILISCTNNGYRNKGNRLIVTDEWSIFLKHRLVKLKCIEIR